MLQAPLFWCVLSTGAQGRGAAPPRQGHGQFTATRRASPGRTVLLVSLFRLRISPGEVLKRREMLHSVSPERTVYMTSLRFPAGILTFCPTRSLCGSSRWLFASRMAVRLMPYCRAMEARVSPERTSCDRVPPAERFFAELSAGADFFDAATAVAAPLFPEGLAAARFAGAAFAGAVFAGDASAEDDLAEAIMYSPPCRFREYAVFCRS